MLIAASQYAYKQGFIEWFTSEPLAIGLAFLFMAICLTIGAFLGWAAMK